MGRPYMVHTNSPPRFLRDTFAWPAGCRTSSRDVRGEALARACTSFAHARLGLVRQHAVEAAALVARDADGFPDVLEVRLVNSVHQESGHVSPADGSRLTVDDVDDAAGFLRLEAARTNDAEFEVTARA
eukprot:scaffold105528_cov69-Phaeocystis_antarctica.AAC.2